VWADVLEGLLAGQDLTEERAEAVLGTIMRGEAEPSQAAGFLVALRAKGETAAELAGLVRAMVAAAVPLDVPGPLVDTCGTGGDRAGTFNISTVAAVVAAASGARVAKHGNRAASSACGSADLIEAWGIDLELPPSAVATTIEELGIGFLYARSFHPAMRHVGPIRQHLGIRTVFNVLGPLCNPAHAERQVVGVADPALAPVMAEALARLGRRAMVFRGSDGLDELTTTGPSDVWDVRDGVVTAGTITPDELDLPRVRPEDLLGGDLDTNVRIAEEVLAGDEGPAADAVALNAAAALVVADIASDLGAGVARAREALSSGAAKELRDRWVARARELKDQETVAGG
jgi:anthranilate phosphoribosyltransferase